MVKKFIKTILVSILLFFVVIGIIQGSQSKQQEYQLISYPEMKTIMQENKNQTMSLYKTSDGVLQLTVDGKHYRTNIDSTSSVDDLVKNYKVLYDEEKDSGLVSGLWSVAKWVLIILAALFVLSLFRGKSGTGGGGAGGIMNFGKMSSTVKRSVPQITMKDVGGLTPEMQEEVHWAIKLFREMGSAIAMGISPTKAILFYGPPGTGKTTIAKAMAGEMNATFYQTSGSEFVEMFVGVGASRVRDIFADAKKNAPSVIFVDEFDAIGGKREVGGSGSGKEAEQTLNQLLVELSELKPEDRVFVVAATNFVEKLDPAVIRPGRFDYKIKIDLPDLEGRKEIIKIHSKGKPLAQDVKDSLENLAKNMYGYSGADIEDVFKQAARKAFIDGRAQISMKDISYALDRNLMGSQGRPIDKLETKKRVAYHEAGHALISVLTKRGSVRQASITPRGQAAGAVITIPEDLNLSTRSELMNRLKMTLAGGIAERFIFGEHSVGVSGDLEQTKNIIEAMVNKVGMASNSMKMFFDEKDKKREMEKIFEEAASGCQQLITENKQSFERIAKALLEKETITGDEIENLVYGTEENLDIANNL